jgi:hypothetical protein
MRPGLDNGYPTFGCALAFAHPNFSGFLGKRFVRKNSNPNLAAPLHVTGHGDTGSFDLF